jgi:hypothetical protein
MGIMLRTPGCKRGTAISDRSTTQSIRSSAAIALMSLIAGKA